MSDEASGPSLVDLYAGVMTSEGPHRLDEARLADYLSARLPHFEGPLVVEQFRGGQSNPTYRVSAGAQRYVLRKKPPGKLLQSAHAIEREYRVMTALSRVGIPVPRTYFLCDDESVIGTPFFLMEFVDGRIFWDGSLPGQSKTERTAIYAEMCQVLAALHGIDPATIGLENYGKSGNYFQRQLDRWTTQYRAAESERIDVMEDLLAWLPENLPHDDQRAIVHADYRIDNLIFHPREPRILAILDWELSTLGHPLGDLGAHCTAWRLPPEQWGLNGLDLAALGIPNEVEYVRSYCRAVGRAGIVNWNFYLTFALFRKAAIAQGIVKRTLSGNVSSRNPLRIDRVYAYARLAWACAIAPRMDILVD